MLRSEQGKLPTARAFRLAERDKHMSEQKINFMAQLDAWTDEMVIAPLLENGAEAVKDVQYAIREKTLESYKNGCRAAAGAVRKEFQRGRK